MQKKYILVIKKSFFILYLFTITSLLYSQELGDRIYKEVLLNGKVLNKWLELSVIEEYDVNGNLIHYKDNDGEEEWYEYDPEGHEIYYRNNEGKEEWHEYNSKGEEIFYKLQSDGLIKEIKIDSNNIRTEYYKANRNHLNEEHWDEYKDNNKNLWIHSKTIYYTTQGTKEIWYEYDDNNQVIHGIHTYEPNKEDNHETKFSYDDKGNLILVEDSGGRIGKTWYEYDSNGNRIHRKDSSGYEEWFEYNSDNKLIHGKRPGYEEWYEYDFMNNLVHAKKTDGYEEWQEYKYNQQNQMIYHKKKDHSGKIFEEWIEYDKQGNIRKKVIHNINGSEECTKWDELGNVIYSKNSSGLETWKEYLPNTKLIIHEKRSDGFEKWIDYDSNNNEIHFKTLTYESWSEYEYYSNGVIKMRKTFSTF